MSRPSTLPPVSVEDSAGRLLSEQFGIVETSVAEAVGGGGDKALHDIRIAIRRMRAVLRAFRAPLEKTSAARIERDLQTLNRALGSARDMDAWIGLLSEKEMAGQLAAHRLSPRFLSHQQELRRVQQATVRRQLQGRRFSSLKSRIRLFIERELPAAAAASPWVDFRGPAKRAIRKEFKRALRLGKLRKSASPEDVHRLRIGLRRLRYLAGFFGEALGGTVGKLGRRAHAVERALGGMRDAQLALERIRLEGPPPPRLLVRHLEQRRRGDPRAVEAAWKRLTAPSFLASVKHELKK